MISRKLIWIYYLLIIEKMKNAIWIVKDGKATNNRTGEVFCSDAPDGVYGAERSANVKPQGLYGTIWCDIELGTYERFKQHGPVEYQMSDVRLLLPFIDQENPIVPKSVELEKLPAEIKPQFGEWVSIADSDNDILPPFEIKQLIVLENGVMQTGYFNGADNYGYVWFCDNNNYHYPTHWMPLPSPPKSTEK